MPNIQFKNNATTALASGISNSATSLTVTGGAGAKFPTLTGSQYFYCTLSDVATKTVIEIIKVTARSTDTFTIVRAQEGTTGTAFLAGDIVELRMTNQGLADLISQSSVYPNLLPNPNARVATRGAVSITTNLTTSRLIGSVDCCALWASTGAVSAGTITQNTSSITGTTGYAARAAGTTLTGSAVLSFAVRMEARDAALYKNQTASFQVAVAHDVGSNVNYTIIVKKANSADNWGAMATISTSGATAVTTATGTVLKFEGVSMGDCSTGIEIEVQAACGAVTTKNFDFTEWALTIGTTAPTFSNGSYERDVENCARYLQKMDLTSSQLNFCLARNTALSVREYDLRPYMRIAPTGITTSALAGFILLNEANSTSGAPTGLVVTGGTTDKSGVNITTTAGSPTIAAGNGVWLYSTGTSYILFTGAELF